MVPLVYSVLKSLDSWPFIIITLINTLSKFFSPFPDTGYFLTLAKYSFASSGVPPRQLNVKEIQASVKENRDRTVVKEVKTDFMEEQLQ